MVGCGSAGWEVSILRCSHCPEPPEDPLPDPPSENGQLRPLRPIESRSSLHVGHTGYFEASREGIHTFPHKATTGWPVTIEELALSRRTKWAKRSPSPGTFSFSTSVRSSSPVEEWVEGPAGEVGAPGRVGSSRASGMLPIVGRSMSVFLAHKNPGRAFRPPRIFKPQNRFTSWRRPS